jgi:uncharacterized protein YmfQ (DUF2313 family)
MKRTNLYVALTAAGFVLSGACFAADKAAPPPPSDTVPYSDRDQMNAIKGDKDALEKALKTGQGKDFYRQELQKMGYHITAVNHDKADYLEYEIVKGKNTFEVQIDIDEKTKMSKKVDVTTNAWKTDATERALKDASYRPEYPKTTTQDAAKYSDRDRSKNFRSEKDRLEKSMRLGEGKDFYKQELEKMGYKITSVNKDKADYTEYEVVKGTDTYEVQIDFDSKTAKAKKVDVTANAWKHEATERALRGDMTSAVRK